MCTRIVTAKLDREPIRPPRRMRARGPIAVVAVRPSAARPSSAVRAVSAPAGQHAEHHEADSHQGKEDQQSQKTSVADISILTDPHQHAGYPSPGAD